MNYLFYLGIIAPTLITLFLFIIFVYCWFLQKARKEVLTKKYDPHGKMRRLGIPMDPPLPPAYCRIDDNIRFVDNGEDNEAYDVSRSPSTEQDQRGRPMYHTYHDSGISAGFSPSQESEPRPGLSYRTCPDSGISGFSVQGPMAGPSQHICRGCCQARDQMPHVHHLQQSSSTSSIRPFNLPPQHQQVILHHNTVQASVHPTHGVCYGDDMTHPQSPQHYNPPPMQTTSTFNVGSPTACSGRHFTTMPHIHEQPAHMTSANILEQAVCYYSNGSPEHRPYNPHGIHLYCQEEDMEGDVPDHPLNPPPPYPSTFRPQNPRTMALMTPANEDSRQTDNQNDFSSTSSSPLSQKQSDVQAPANGYPHQTTKPTAQSLSSSQPPRHSYRDSGILDVGQPLNATSDRPDSQASASSTTDSEDSGFRSSHIAANHSSKLSKHGNPLLKPLRRPKHNMKTRSKPSRAGDEDLSVHGATPLSTLNPQNLQCQVPNNTKPQNVIQTTSLHDEQQGQRSPPRILQHQNGLKCASNALSSDSTQQNSVGSYQNDSSGCHSPGNSSNQDTGSNQHPDMTEISTHLSWKYLQDLSVSSNSSQDDSNNQDGLQLCHKVGVNKGQPFQQEPQIEMLSYSIV